MGSYISGSSTLHNVWRCAPFRGQVSNFYYDIIIGGKIHDSHFSYLANTESWQVILKKIFLKIGGKLHKYYLAEKCDHLIYIMTEGQYQYSTTIEHGSVSSSTRRKLGVYNPESSYIFTLPL